MTTWTNGKVSLTKDMIFGVSVLGTWGWVPIYQIGISDIERVIRLVDNNPSCPFLSELSTQLEEARNADVDLPF